MTATWCGQRIVEVGEYRTRVARFDRPWHCVSILLENGDTEIVGVDDVEVRA